jgi:hypothetical protein
LRRLELTLRAKRRHKCERCSDRTKDSLRTKPTSDAMRVTRHSRLSGGNYFPQVRAALETPKLSSSIWKRVTTSPMIVRMIANCVTAIFPVALIRVCSRPMIAARLLLARMSSTSKVMGSVSVRISWMKSTIARRPVLRPIQGRTPSSPWISNTTSASTAQIVLNHLKTDNPAEWI